MLLYLFQLLLSQIHYYLDPYTNIITSQSTESPWNKNKTLRLSIISIFNEVIVVLPLCGMPLDMYPFFKVVPVISILASVQKTSSLLCVYSVCLFAMSLSSIFPIF